MVKHTTTSSAHTVGPWHWYNGEITGNGMEAKTVCKMPMNNADARLIAAAPELIEALCDLLDSTEATFDNRHERAAAKEAIEKALS